MSLAAAPRTIAGWPDRAPGSGQVQSEMPGSNLLAGRLECPLGVADGHQRLIIVARNAGLEPGGSRTLTRAFGQTRSLKSSGRLRQKDVQPKTRHPKLEKRTQPNGFRDEV